MKKSRFFTIMTIFVVVVFIFLFSSPIFTLSKVEMLFVDKNSKNVLLTNNKKIKTEQQVDKILSSCNYDYGNSIFLLDKNKYNDVLESRNPYIRVINSNIIFPNKLSFYVQERTPFCFFNFDSKNYIIDDDFKLLEIISEENISLNEIIEIKFFKNNKEMNFFEFFNLSIFALSEGDFLTDNNLLFNSIKNFGNILNSKFNLNTFSNLIKSICINEVSTGVLDLNIYTNNESYGVILVVEDILNCFDKKTNKLLDAFETLCKKEKIKTAYGELRISKAFNCFWNNL